MDLLPDDILKTCLFPNIPVKDLNTLRMTSQKFNTIYKDPNIWIQKISIKFPNSIQYKPATVTWMNLYRTLSCGICLPVYYRGDIVGYHFHLHASVSLDDILIFINARKLADIISVVLVDSSLKSVKCIPVTSLNKVTKIPSSTERLVLYTQETCSSQYLFNEITSTSSSIPIYAHDSFVIENNIRQYFFFYSMHELKQLILQCNPNFDEDISNKYSLFVRLKEHLDDIGHLL